MIRIYVCHGCPFVWSSEDWLTLRQDHRIVGQFDGAQAEHDFSSNHKTLPLRLTTVETQFLIKNGLAQAYCPQDQLYHLESHIGTKPYEEIQKKRYETQVVDYKNRRREALETVVDKIIEGKRKKGIVAPDRETIIQDELNKIKKIPFEFVPIELRNPWISEQEYKPVEFPMPKTPIDSVRLRVFEDFHKRNYYLTSGTKFGGDFLAYPGDPSEFHSEYIIICEENDRRFPELYIVSHRRLAGSVKKKLLIASLELETGKLNYRMVRKFFPENVDQELGLG